MSTTRLRPLLACGALSPFLLYGCGGGICDPRGLCPPPDPALLVNTAHISKSVWLEDPRIGRPNDDRGDGVVPSLCSADLDPRPGPELIFRESPSLLVISPNNNAPDVLAFLEATEPKSVQFADLDGDGDSEFFSHYTEERFIFPNYVATTRNIAVWKSSGELQWVRAVTDPFVHLVGDWARADWNGDGREDFAVTRPQHVEILNFDGSLIRAIGNERYAAVRFADLDGDRTLELVTRSNRTAKISVWNRAGDLVRTFDSPSSAATSYLRAMEVARAPDARTDVLVFRVDDECHALASDGTRVAVYPADDDDFPGCVAHGDASGNAPLFSPVDYRAPLINAADCQPYDETITGPPFIFFELDTLDPYVRMVRLDADREPFRAEVTWSLEYLPYFFGLPSSRISRTILKLYGANDALVFHEVLNGGGGLNSAVVIPSNVENEEILLLAADTRILAYSSADRAARPQNSASEVPFLSEPRP